MWPAIISAGANIIGGLFGKSSAKEQNRAADRQAQREMDFQERMSSTSHQREVVDLRAAGLNPILSAHGGASSPGGAMAPVVNTSEPLRDSINKSSAAALDAANIFLIRETANTQKTQQELNRANAAKSIAETGGYFGNAVLGRIPVSSAASAFRRLGTPAKVRPPLSTRHERFKRILTGGK